MRATLFTMTDARKIASSDRFETDLKKLSVDSNPYVRERVVEFMGTVKGDKYIDPIISALNDSNVEVRSRAITTIWQRKDAKMVFNNYVLKHQDDPAYDLSVKNVKSALTAMNASGQNGK
jgi:HEAT repeat protein